MTLAFVVKKKMQESNFILTSFRYTRHLKEERKSSEWHSYSQIETKLTTPWITKKTNNNTQNNNKET